MKTLIVGDPHATPDELGDCETLISRIEGLAKEQDVDGILLLGDLFHNHAILHTEVLAFWVRSLERLSELGLPIQCLVGNHDMPGNDGSAAHALMGLKHIPGVQVIDGPCFLAGVAYIPYQSDEQKFLAMAKELGGQTLICHQTFQGCTFENGFYAKDGFNSEAVPQSHILSGHIHAGQEFGRVWYPGAPRWRTLSDANSERSVWVVEFDTNGAILSKTPFATGCRQIRHAVIEEGGPDITLDPSPNIDWRVDIKGSTAFIDGTKKQLEGRGIRIRTIATQAASIKVKESEGISVAFSKFLHGFQTKYGTPAAILEKMAQERL